MSDTGQALLWDALRAEYRLVKAGDRFQGHFIVTIRPDAVVVSNEANPTIRHTLRLTPVPTNVLSSQKPREPTAITVAPNPSPLAPSGLGIENPYPADGLAPVDPYPTLSRRAPTVVAPTVIDGSKLPPGPAVRSVRAPELPVVPPQRAAKTPAPAAKPSAPKLRQTKPAPSTPAAAPKSPRTERVVMQRADLAAALDDFSTLSKEVQIQPAPGGGVRILGVARGSLPHRLGLRRGDIVRAVAGERVTTVESAARIYARLQAVERFDVEVDRGGARVIFGVSLK